MEKFSKQTVFYTDGFNEPSQETVIIDEDGMILYSGEDNLYPVDEKEQKHYFSTKADAELFREQMMKKAVENAGIVDRYIYYLRNHGSDEEERVEELKNELRYTSYDLFDSTDDSYYERRYNVLTKALQAFKTGVLNVNAETIRTEDIKHVKWGSRHARIILSDGASVVTRNEKEFEILNELIGENRSGRIFPNIDNEIENRTTL